MSKRFQKHHRLNLELDLHGIQHSEASILVEDFVLNNQDYLPLKIITGNSKKMKMIVITILKTYNFQYSDGDYYNRGYIDVLN